MLKINNLHASVEGKSILKGINLEIKPGEVLKIEFETDSWINIGKENAKFIWIEKPDYNNFLKI